MMTAGHDGGCEFEDSKSALQIMDFQGQTRATIFAGGVNLETRWN